MPRQKTLSMWRRCLVRQTFEFTVNRIIIVRLHPPLFPYSCCLSSNRSRQSINQFCRFISIFFGAFVCYFHFTYALHGFGF